MCAAILISIIARSHLLHTHKCPRTRKDTHRYKQTHVCDTQGETARYTQTHAGKRGETNRYQDFVSQPQDFTCHTTSQEQQLFFFPQQPGAKKSLCLENASVGGERA
jgi:hypothetical protein